MLEEIDCPEFHRFGERQPYMIADDIGQTIVNSGLATRKWLIVCWELPISKSKNKQPGDSNR